MAGEEVIFEITAGLPYSRTIKIKEGTNTWPTLDDFEVKSELRKGKTDTTPLILNLAPFISKDIDETTGDIVLTFSATGAQTRTFQKGNFDIIVSDVGVEDARAVPAVTGGKFVVRRLTTGP